MQIPGQIVAVSTTPPNVRGSHNCLKRLGRLPRLSDREMNWCFLWFFLFSSEILTWCPRRGCFRPTKKRRAKEVPACSSASQRPGIKYQSDKGTQMTNFHSDKIFAWYSGTSPGECVPWLVRPLQSHPPSTGKPPPIKDLLSDLFSWKIVLQHVQARLVIAAESDVVSKLLAWVPLASAHLPSEVNLLAQTKVNRRKWKKLEKGKWKSHLLLLAVRLTSSLGCSIQRRPRLLLPGGHIWISRMVWGNRMWKQTLNWLYLQGGQAVHLDCSRRSTLEAPGTLPCRSHCSTDVKPFCVCVFFFKLNLTF